MNKFKAGDWVTHIPTGEVFEVSYPPTGEYVASIKENRMGSDYTVSGNLYHASDCKLWQPKAGDGVGLEQNYKEMELK